MPSTAVGDAGGVGADADDGAGAAAGAGAAPSAVTPLVSLASPAALLPRLDRWPPKR